MKSIENPEQLNKSEENELASKITPEQSLNKVTEEQDQEPKKSLEEIVVEQKTKDQEKIKEVRDSLERQTKRDRWQAIRKPKDEWYEEKEITTDNPFDLIGKWFKSFNKIEREKKKENEECQKEFSVNRRKHPEVDFDYKKGSGVEGRVVKNQAILAKGFHECSGLVFQTKDSVSVVHISPNVIRGTFAGGEIVHDKNIDGHIKSALKELLGQDRDIKATNKETQLTPQEIEILQKMADSGQLRSTMLSGEDQYVPDTIAIDLGQNARFHGLPSIKTDIHYIGNQCEGEYAIHASPENLYFIGVNNKVLKKGKNFPPTMYEFKEK